MRIKKGEKWYGGIVSLLLMVVIAIICTRGEIKGKVNGEEKVIDKSTILMGLIPGFILIALGIGFVLRFWFLKSNDFICKYCKKEYGGSFETEKNVCKTCYEKRRY